MELNRRDFLKGAVTAGAVAASGAALAGCTSQSDDGGSATSGGSDSDAVLTAASREQKWSFEIAPDQVADSEITQTYTADIIVVGSGMAGLATAFSAKEQGADVMVFSASTTPISRGGSNHAIGSTYQQEMGVDYTPEIAREIVKTEQTSGTYFMDKRKWERWINNSAESIDWMIDRMESKGLNVCLEPGYYDPDGILTVPAASHNFWTEEQPFGALFGAPMQAQAYADLLTDAGAEIHYSTVAQYLIRDDDNTGRVSAVVAKNSDGAYVKYVANKAVVLATGDFSKNPDMMAKYSPWAYDIFKDQLAVGDPDYDTGLAYNGLMPGDGQKMGLWIGAAWQKTFPCAPMINGGAAGPSHAVISNFWGINLAIDGRRYQNENTNFAYGAISVLQLPQRTAYSVWDIAYAYTQEKWEPFGTTVGEVNGIMPYTPEEYIATWDENVEAGGGYFRADTIEELVAQLEGIDQEAAIESIANYNRYAEQGYDEEFQLNPEILYPISTPPFYGAKTVDATFLTVCGGLRTDENMQVCDADDNPIEGLYNTGIMTGDFYANSYNFVMPGQNLGAICCTLSYLLGHDLAEL